MPIQLVKTDTAVIDRIEDVYLSFPDVVLTPAGTLLCAYRQADIHYPPKASETFLVLQDSRDGGKTWENRRIFPYAPRNPKEWAWHCPRLTILKDGRIALLCDLSFPEKAMVSIYYSVSSDDGATWSEPIDTGAFGIIPDRLIEFDDGELLFTAHYSRLNTNQMFQFLYASNDGGSSWQQRSIVAEDAQLHFCEGSIVKLPDNRLVCYLRENSFLHLPTYVTTSTDRGHTWSSPVPHPTHGHRPCAGLLDDTTVLVTYRNVAGNPGLAGWVGKADELGFQAGGRDVSGHGARLTEDGLSISSAGKQDDGVEFYLPPILDWSESFTFSATMRTVSCSPLSAGLRAGGVLSIGAHGICFDHLHQVGGRFRYLRFGEMSLDTSKFHHYEIRYKRPVFEVFVDGAPVIHGVMSIEVPGNAQRVIFGAVSEYPALSTKFRDHRGESVWRDVNWEISAPDGSTRTWSWNFRSGTFPNQYQRDREFTLDHEESALWPESGYSGWIRLGPKHIYCVDYRRGTEKKPYIVGHTIRLDDCQE